MFSEYQPRFRHAVYCFAIALGCAFSTTLVQNSVLLAFLWGCVALWMWFCVSIVNAIIVGSAQEKKTNRTRALADFLHYAASVDYAVVVGAAQSLGFNVPDPVIVEPERVIYQATKTSGAGVEVWRHEVYNYASLKQLQLLANGLKRGLKLKHDDFTPARNGFTEKQFAALQSYLVEIGLAGWKNAEDHKAGCFLTAEGEAFFATLETETEDQPTPPPGFIPFDSRQK